MTSPLTRPLTWPLTWPLSVPLGTVSGGGGADILVPTVTYTGGNEQRLGQATGIYNLNSTHGLALRALLRAHSAMTWLFAGDSTTAGVSSAAGAVRADSYPTRIAANLQTAGWETATDSYFGDANTGSAASYQTYLPAMTTFGSGWGFTAVNTLAGKSFQNTSTTTGDLAFQRAKSSNCADIISLGNAGVYKVRYGNIDQANVTPAVTPEINRVTWLNAGTVMAIRRNSGTVGLAGAILRDTATPRIDIANAGWSGSGSTAWADNSSANRGFRVIQTLEPEVVFLNMLIGEWGDASGISVATTKANMESIIQMVIAYGGIVGMIVPHPTPTSIASAQRQADWTDAAYDLADQYSLPLFDFHAFLGNDYANAVTAGYTYDTSSHYNAAGYAAEGDFFSDGVELLAG
jgi:lysophospholipase L1-like esterase